MQTCAFSDEINFEKLKKVRSQNLDPCNPNFFHDKS